ncbi:SNARE associated golgi protein [Nitzschia inconspicua]|uniref:SNARE associated golgi protein n=1 Tax=Nitzschia inconspicua TaxID=303405 RepID=A0A9K3LSN3_9STRA|nr:SNARE associated golgi protein [Nitzschia inconspicua]
MTKRTLSPPAVCSAILVILVFPLGSFSWVSAPSPLTPSHKTPSADKKILRRPSARAARRDPLWRRNVLEDSNVIERTVNFATFFNRTFDAADDIIITENTNEKKNLMWVYTSPQDPVSANRNKNDRRKVVPSISEATTHTTGTESKKSYVLGRESLLMAFALVSVAVGVFSYAQTDAGSNLFPFMSIADGTGNNLLETTRGILSDPGSALDAVVDKVNSMGPLGIIYFGAAYTIAEILAIPAIPLTASAGYLFGPVEGTAVVLVSASVAAGVSFAIGRTLLRDYVEGILQDYPEFAKLDRAIGKEGFKLMLLLRLSPIFPFALSNYLYGASSIQFPAFFGGTLLGFAPGTLAYVYAGYIGKALTTDGSEVYPWYVYLGGLTLFAGLLKILADTATRIVEEIEAEDDDP